jgi:hypothetical protein
MKFNFWLVILFALAPLFIFFAGLSAAGGFGSAADWEIAGIVAAAACVVAYFARQGTADNAIEATADAPATEGSERSEHRDLVAGPGYASPACLLHEADLAYLGYASRDEVLALLNKLLEAERAGARGARAMSTLADSAHTRQALQEVAKDEARFCAMLFQHITRLGESPSRRTGAFHEKLAALETLDDRLELLNRGQGWVVRKLADAVPRIADESLRTDLQEMLDAHRRNIARCTELAEPSELVA